VEQLLRYGAVGLANTAIGFGLIWLCLALGLGDYPANALGYAAGLTFSYFANRRFTFRLGGRSDPAEVGRFAFCFAVAYGANLLIVTAGREIGLAGAPALHLAAMVTYSALFFVLMRGYAFGAPPSTTQPRQLTHHLPEIGLAAMAFVALAVLHNNALTHDVVWQFWIARQMLAGAELYRDIWEVNPPLWFWSAMPLEWLAGRTGVAPFAYLTAVMIGMATFAAWAVDRLSGFDRPGARLAQMGAVFWLLVLLEPFDFGQREQFALIGALPYAALIAHRREGHRVSVALALAIGSMAAYGFALKHYFALTPLALEAWLWFGRRSAYRLLRPETLALGAAAAAYGTATLLLAPSFLENMVPMVSAAYGGYEQPWTRWFDEPAQTVWALAVLTLLYSYQKQGRVDRQPLLIASLIVAGCFLVAYLAQQKGWQYHATPVTAALLFALVVRMLQPGVAARYIMLIPLGLALTIGLLHGSYNNFLRVKDEPLLTRAAPGSSVVILSADPMWAWPVLEENGLRWPLNHYSQWMLPSIGRAEMDGAATPELAALGERLRRQIVHDMRCLPPALILIETGKPRYPMQPRRFNVTDWFMREPEFGQFVAQHYRPAPGNKLLRVFELRHPLAGEGSGCRAIADPAWPVTQHDKRGRAIGTAPALAGPAG
jgi:putative flippase GtrA